MTTPIDISTIVPLKAKAWVGLVGSLLTFAGPFILENANLLPSPWPALIGVFFALATALGIYRAPYKPAGTVLVEPTVDGPSPGLLSDEAQGTYQNPWKA